MPPTTALRKYQRLESPGLWRETPVAQRREVIVGLREATLILADPKSEMPLAQWSLPAVTRQNPGELPAIYTPGDDNVETLEVEDRDMIAALDTLHRVLERRRPHPGRLRGAILAAVVLTIGGLGVFWMPGRLMSHTAAMLPEPTRADLGRAALADLQRLSGQPCKSVPGRRAAAVLAARLFPDTPPEIEVLREGLARPMHLPGNLLLLPADLVEKADSPEVIAGYLVAEAAMAASDDPILPLLQQMGVTGTVRLLATGRPGENALDGYGEVLARQSLTPPATPGPDDETLLAAFTAARLPSSPYAWALDPTGEAVLGLIEADPFAHAKAERVLSDESWLEFQAICTE